MAVYRHLARQSHHVLVSLFFFAALAFSTQGFALAVTWTGPSKQIFDAGEGHFMYTTSSILMDGVEYHFYCTNKDPFVIRDHVGLTQVRHSDGVVVSPNQIVLAPTADGWDAQHTCDPAVVRGKFKYDGVDYAWAMFYLGEAFTDESKYGCCMHCQLGVAFAQDLNGPWIKWEGNPFIPFTSDEYWGVGQPSVFSLDQAGTVQLIYSRGDADGTRMISVPVNMADMDALSLGQSKTVPTTGLTNIDGSAPILHNADFAYDPVRKKVYVSRPRHPFSTKWPTMMESELQIAAMDYESFLAGNGAWEVIGHINQSNTGKARNHNSCILRTPYGRIAELDKLTVSFCASDEGGNWLYSYRIHAITGTLSDKAYADTTPREVEKKLEE